jgi:hypothetical protein
MNRIRFATVALPHTWGQRGSGPASSTRQNSPKRLKGVGVEFPMLNGDRTCGRDRTRGTLAARRLRFTVVKSCYALGGSGANLTYPTHREPLRNFFRFTQ